MLCVIALILWQMSKSLLVLQWTHLTIPLAILWLLLQFLPLIIFQYFPLILLLGIILLTLSIIGLLVTFRHLRTVCEVIFELVPERHVAINSLIFRHPMVFCHLVYVLILFITGFAYRHFV